jgi:hypothetical protein
MNLLELLHKTGHGIKVAAKDTGKALEIAGKETVKEIPTVTEIAAEAAPFIPLPFFSPVAKTVESITEMIHPPAHTVTPETLPASLPVAKAMASLFSTSITGDKMNPLESFGITIVLGILQTVIKNPAHKAALEHQLVGIADQIYMTYGKMPPAPAPEPTATAPTSISGH